jgi:hypothetical protein
MAFPKKCLDCGAEVDYDGTDVQYSGFGPCKKHPGKHRVESITYYHSGARDIQDQRDRRKFAPQLVLVPAYPKQDPKTGLTVNTRGLTVQFGDGKLDTEDPEVQYYIERNAQVAWGEEGLKMWREIYLNEKQQVDIAKAELLDLENKTRKLREENSALEAVRANSKAGKAVSG